MKALVAEGNYNAAAEIADSINWRKEKNVNLLVKAGDIYAKLKRPKRTNHPVISYKP